jgi:hypothetical protein
MSYNITRSDGTSTITIADNSVNTSATNLPFVGKNTPNYAEPIATSLLRLLENFASDVAPGDPANLVVVGQPTEGQLWYKKDTKTLHVFDGVTFASIYGSNANPLDFYASSITASPAGDPCTLNGDFILSPGSTLQATYADLAERFYADRAYEVGTLLEIGGANEVTETTSHASTAVFGVVAENPAYIMNATAGTNDTHPPVALAGRVQVKVVGPVTKGDRLISSTMPGVAVSVGYTNDYSIVFGRALEDKSSAGVELIWVAVGAK